MPTTIPASPLTTSSRALRRAAVDCEPVSRATFVPFSAPPSIPRSASGPSMAVIERWCWVASTSVGASSAACAPASTTESMARSATTVLPEPTSPCSSRCIGQSCAMSSAISAATARCPAVSSKGTCASNASSRPPATGRRGVAVTSRSAARFCASATCRTNASSKSEPPARLLPVLVGRRPVDRAQCRLDPHHPPDGPQIGRDRVGDVGEDVEDQADGVPDLAGLHALALRVHRVGRLAKSSPASWESTRKKSGCVSCAWPRELAHLAAEHRGLALGEDPREPLGVEERDLVRGLPVEDRHLVQLGAVAGASAGPSSSRARGTSRARPARARRAP